MDERTLKNLQVRGEEVSEIIETHISWVVLTEKHAYKIKKPVKFPFVDFSDLDSRKHYCDTEVRLNRRLAPEVYLGIKEISFVEENALIGAEKGVVIDYCVQMKLLDTSKQMHILLEKGRVLPAQACAIARIIAGFHKKAEIIDQIYSAKNRKSWFNDLQTVKEIAVSGISTGAGELIDRAIAVSDTILETYHAAFVARVTSGMIRDVHGDLHSGNIFLYDEPVIFDGIEFNTDFRRIDLLDEVGFFCMDMEAFGRKDLSKSFMEEYVQSFPEVMAGEGTEILRVYYKLYRANVRAKVMLLKAGQHKGDKTGNSAISEAKTYIDLMEVYLDQLAPMI